MITGLLNEVGITRFVFLVFIIIITNAFEVFGVSLFIPIIELLQNAGSTSTGLSAKFFEMMKIFGLAAELPNFLYLLCGLFLVKAALSMWLRYQMVGAASEVQHKFRSKLFSSLLDATVGYVSQNRQGELLSILSEHTVRVSVALFLLVQLIAAWIAVAAYISIVITISWQLTLFSLVLGGSFVPLVRHIGRKAQMAGLGYVLASENLNHHSAEALYSKKMINAMNWSPSVEQRFTGYSVTLRDFWLQMAFWSNSPGILMQPLAVGILSLIVLFSLRFDLSTPLLGAFVLSFIRLIPNLQAAVSMGVELQANKSSVQRVQDILKQSAESKEHTGVKSYAELRAGLLLRDVKFSYDGHKQVLNGASLEIVKGQTVALVGPSGAGKTTIADLILGLYRPQSGAVLIDGVALSEIKLKSYRQHVAYVSQDSVMFHDTIRHNLTLGIDRVITDAELQSVCASAGAWEFVAQRQGGLDAVIGDRGLALSGGQRQRLALARALLRCPHILVLDEATSALDQDGEHWIQCTLQALQKSGEVTIILIAHRYSTIEHADLIYEVRDGLAKCLGNWAQARAHLIASGPGSGMIQ